MNPYTNFNPYMPQYMQNSQPAQAQPIQHIPQPAEPKVVSYAVDSAEQLASITPLPNTIYLGISRDGSKIFQRRMNNDGLVEVKTYSLAGEKTKKTDTQEILDRITSIERKLNIGVIDESNVIDVTQ